MPSEVSAATGDQSAEELRRELAEAREQQAATAEILAAISSSPTDPRGALERIAASAARLCEAYDATIHQVDGGFLRIVAHNGPLPVAGRHMPLTRGRLFARAVSDRRTIHIADLQAETDEYPEGSDIARRLGYHTILVVPLIRAGEAIGTIGIRRTEVRPFSDKQIALLETFAKQAVIAIENTRLFEAEQASKRELQESLEYQTATSEVLNVISRSPTDVHPVFDTIARSSLHLCAGTFSTVFRFDGHLIHFAAAHGMTPEAVEAMHRTYARRDPRRLRRSRFRAPSRVGAAEFQEPRVGAYAQGRASDRRHHGRTGQDRTLPPASDRATAHLRRPSRDRH